MCEKNPRVLIISHNVLDKRTSMGKTITSFFADWDPDNLAQLYFQSEVPTTNMCVRYYRITDMDALKSIFTRRKKKLVGKHFDEAQIDTTRASSREDVGLIRKIYSFGRKRTSFIYIARNTVWNLSKWYSRELRTWISRFGPEVIFFASGDYAFAYNIAYTISKDYNIPIVTYCCDDYYINRLNPESFFSKPVHHSLMRSVKRCISRSSGIITICDKLSDAYKNLFDKPIYTVYTGYSHKEKENVDGKGIVYLGNLGWSRHKSLVDIGRALKNISERTGKELHLDVYSAEDRKEILCELTEKNGIIFHGAVDSEEVRHIINKSKIVVHTESFDPTFIHKVEYSISTKIADLLASGRCILAYGPENVASIEYLRQNNAACVVSDRKLLEEELESILSDRDRRGEIVKNAKKLSEVNHNSRMVPQKIAAIIRAADEDAKKSR